MQESYFFWDNECYFLAHSDLKKSRPSILFIHGLGDSSISYQAYLHSRLIEDYNILIPDLLGYGKSSAAKDYYFNHQIAGIEQQLLFLQQTKDFGIENILLVAHSMGGIHATLLCESKLKHAFKGFINVEGSITQFGSFIAEKMQEAATENNFANWFEQFKQNEIYDHLAQQYISIRSYYASLEFCSPEAFLQNGMEMYQMSQMLNGKYTHLIGKKYLEVSIPKIYCYGDTISPETLQFLEFFSLDSLHFPCENHFLLAECRDQFVSFIADFAKKIFA